MSVVSDVGTLCVCIVRMIHVPCFQVYSLSTERNSSAVKTFPLSGVFVSGKSKKDEEYFIMSRAVRSPRDGGSESDQAWCCMDG